jgi:site-specific DNA-methyltransferase (adenine-specific)
MKKPYFKNGDNFKLFLEDSLKFLNEEVKEDSVDMIFADPPYFLSSGTFTCQNGKRVDVSKGDWDKSNGMKKNFEFHVEWIKACHRVLKPGGTIWISGTYHSIYQCGFALQINKFHILNDIAWFKPNASPNLSCRYFTASHETLLWARKDPINPKTNKPIKTKHKFNYDKMKNGDWPEDAMKKPGLQMRTVWSIYPPKKEEKTFGKHPTQKPIELLNRIVLASTDEGDIVLDPFTGSSTTGLACFLNKRKFVGVDMENDYLELSIKRLKELKDKISKKQ